MLAWYFLSEILRGIVSTGQPWKMVLAAAIGAGGALLSERLMAMVAVAAAALLAVVAFTPIVQRLVSGMLVRDEPQHADAIVALHGAGQHSSLPIVSSDRRLMHAWMLCRQGWASVLVVSVGDGDAAAYEAAVRSQIRDSDPAVRTEFLRPGSDTHDEALATARLAKERGWSRIILVTDPLHMRRASATFSRAGLKVVRCPCGQPEYDVESIETVPSRIQAFRDWLHEAAGWHVYKRRGWL